MALKTPRRDTAEDCIASRPPRNPCHALPLLSDQESIAEPQGPARDAHHTSSDHQWERPHPPQEDRDDGGQQDGHREEIGSRVREYRGQ